ncbi:MAG: type III-A CRISPR-associated RAMP protein Csm5 [Deltaproteobacteria bacterium]|nr:type III-A CRISPR-associated RAMP protein Csm5 [Deltaproteobacteria bacterium]
MQAQTLSLHLKVLSPLHIGCGEAYEPTSFVVKREKGVLVSFNTLNFLAGLDDELLGKFSVVCKKGTVASLLEVYKFIDQHAQDMEGLAVELTPALVQHYQKVLGLTGDKIQKELNQFLLDRTAFSPLNGNVYIPGSAIKGSIRTAVLNLRHGKGRLPKQQKAGELEDNLLGGNFEKSPFSRLKVSDFHPVGPLRRRIVYAVDRKKKPGRFEASAFHQIVEIIEPGAVFAGTISLLPLDDSNVPHGKALTLDEVKNALRTFYGRELEREQGDAAAISSASCPALPGDALPLRIGRHSGAESVTVEGQRDIKILKGKNQPPEFRANATTIWFAAESKDGDGRLRPFGWAALQKIGAEEIKKDEAFLHEQEARIREKRRVTFAHREERMAALRQAEELKKAEVEKRRLQAEEREKQRQDDELHPWKPWLRNLEEIRDWGKLNELVFNHGQAEAWRGESGVAEAVARAFLQVKNANPKKWTPERDARCKEWLEPADIPWPPEEVAPQQGTGKPDGGEKTTEVSELEQCIRGLKDYGQYKSQNITMADLTRSEALALQDRFRDWGIDTAKNDEKKKLWKELQKLIKKPKQ